MPQMKETILLCVAWSTLTRAPECCTRVRPLSEPSSVDSANFGHYGEMRKVAVYIGISKWFPLDR